MFTSVNAWQRVALWWPPPGRWFPRVCEHDPVCPASQNRNSHEITNSFQDALRPHRRTPEEGKCGPASDRRPPSLHWLLMVSAAYSHSTVRVLSAIERIFNNLATSKSP